MRYITCPRNGTISRWQRWKVAAHAIVQGVHARICFLQNRVDCDFTVHIRKFHDGHVHDQRDFSATGYRDDWFRGYVARVLYGDIAAGTAAGGLDVLGGHIRFIPERLASEIDSKGSMWIAAEDFLEGDLIDHPGIIKSTVAVGESDCPRAAQPPAISGILSGSEITQVAVSTLSSYT